MPFAIEAPADPEAAVRRLAELPPGSVAVLAGGTDLLLDLDGGRVRADRVLSLRHLPWRRVETIDGRLRIGSLLALRDLERRPALGQDHPGLLEAIRAVGSVALRARATLGGNIVRSAGASDLLPILLALEAIVEVRGPSGIRSVPLAELLNAPRRPNLGPAELVEAIDLPLRAPSAYLWQRVRPTNDISQVAVAVARPGAGGPWRVALGGVAPVPARLSEAERPLDAEVPTDSAIRAASEAAARWAEVVTDRRASEEYRRQLVGVLTRRALESARHRARGVGGPG